MVFSRTIITRSFVLLASVLLATSNVFAKYRTIAEMKKIAGQVLLQNDDSFLDCALYDNGYVYLWVQYYVSAGNLGYGYDEFNPAE